MTIDYALSCLLCYAVDKKIMNYEDFDYSKNRLLAIFKLQEIEDVVIEVFDIYEVMDFICDYAYEHQLISENIVPLRDCFDSYVMDCFMPRPSELNKEFMQKYQNNPKEATNYFYELSKNSLYIRMNRINNNIVYQEEVGGNILDVTINLSKPEKDPKEIALAKLQKSSNYPKCLLCKENVGYYGSINHPGRANHRIIPIVLNQEEWYLQYSPYAYYNEHCIVLKKQHEPMKICLETFKRLLDFVEQFPHYFLGSNADLPIVGGSILSHDHFQGGCYEFAMAKAKSIDTFKVINYDCTCHIIDWPMSVIRLEGKNKKELAKLAEHILYCWIDYSDEEVDILNYTDQRHNTITPIARKSNELFQLDLVLRNNRVTKTNPLGIFHPHSDIHHIKKENIGLIEVMGLAVLPARLKTELEEIKEVLLYGKSISNHLKIHQEWIDFLKKKYTNFTLENIQQIINYEVAVKFNRCLVDAGVFKQDTKGINAFKKFCKSL